MPEPDDAARYLANLQDEVDAAALYRTLGEVEQQPQLKELYRRMAVVEEKHARFWEEKLRAGGQPAPRVAPGWRSRALGWLARRFGAEFVLSTIGAMERTARQGYGSQPDAEAAGFAADERSHARLLGMIAGPSGVEGGALARLEGRHRAIGGNALRAAVLGVNDGLVSNLSLVMGVAGANLSGRAILVSGFAGLLAGAASMAMGEWLSVQSSRELHQRQIAVEAAEISEFPEEEAQELALIYQAKGLNEADAQKVASSILADKDSALDTLAREELGIDPAELGGSAGEAALTSFVLFIIGAILPVLPFIFYAGTQAILLSLLVSSLGLFLIGSLITLLTGKGVLYSGARQMIFGLTAAALTFTIGKLLGVTLAG